MYLLQKTAVQTQENIHINVDKVLVVFLWNISDTSNWPKACMHFALLNSMLKLDTTTAQIISHYFERLKLKQMQNDCTQHISQKLICI